MWFMIADTVDVVVLVRLYGRGDVFVIEDVRVRQTHNR